VPTAEPIPLHLAGNNAPVAEERDAVPTVVIGEIPEDLAGQYFRNGPNPRTGVSTHLYDGDGMIHSISLRDGRASRYRNRYVRTPLYENPGVDRMMLAFDPATKTIDHRVSTANTHVVEHAGRLLALEEGGLPYEVDRDLATIGPYSFGGALTAAMCAHPKTCPRSGELLFFGVSLSPPHLTYYCAAPSGELTSADTISMPRATLMHDFAMTATKVVFFDSMITFDLGRLARGGSPFSWDDTHGARVGVMPRGGTDADVRWFPIEPCHLSHSANAYDDRDTVVVTGTRIGHADGLPYLHRWTIDLRSGSVREEALDDDASEYPRLPDALVGLRHRFVYSTSFVYEAEPDHREIYKYDLVAGVRTVHRLPAGHTCGEPVFVARRDARREDDGYLITFAHDRSTDRSYVLLVDAGDVGAAPVAEVHLPVRVPAGFHGTWLPEDPTG
jgi:carotenoid cleavage dioxygenase